MADWKTQLAETGDEYLIGLTNKGIVKRAYKDKESACVEFVQVADEAVLKVDGETVTLRLPLGESKCTCPSRSICRHIILGIIVLKEYFQNSVSSVNDKENSIVPADISSKENNIQEADSPLKENNITDTDNASLSTESNKSTLSAPPVSLPLHVPPVQPAWQQRAGHSLDLPPYPALSARSVSHRSQ